MSTKTIFEYIIIIIMRYSSSQSTFGKRVLVFPPSPARDVPADKLQLYNIMYTRVHRKQRSSAEARLVMKNALEIKIRPAI